MDPATLPLTGECLFAKVRSKGLDPASYQCLLSIPGIGSVMAAGILSEIGWIDAFKSQESLAKYVGLVWRENQSGNYRADDTLMSKAGDAYLRYYLLEATSHVKNHCQEFAAFYQKKYTEVKAHQHKRALALTARKFIRLIFGLLAKLLNFWRKLCYVCPSFGNLYEFISKVNLTYYQVA